MTEDEAVDRMAAIAGVVITPVLQKAIELARCAKGHYLWMPDDAMGEQPTRAMAACPACRERWEALLRECEP